MSNENPPDVKIPTDAKAAAKLAAESEEEPGMTEEQRRNLAEVQARIFDI